MATHINNGVWPTMVTIFDEAGQLDISANRLVARRLVSMGSDGIFGVCQSSEMFCLTIDEKVALAEAVKAETDGRVSLVISGHTAEGLATQIADLKRLSAVGADALVLVTNRLAGPKDGEDVFIRNTSAILDALPDVIFGLYECPHPSRRLLTDSELAWCAATGRIRFLKDVSCDAQIQHRRAQIVAGSKLKLYNANTQTLLDSLRAGYSGFNGVMGNFHIDIYKWLYNNIHNPIAEAVQQWLSQSAAIEAATYPVVAKYYLRQLGYPFSLYTRSKDPSLLDESDKMCAHRLMSEEKDIRAQLGLATRQTSKHPMHL